MNWLFHSWRGRNILTPSATRALLRIFERSTVLTDVLQALHDARVLVAPLFQQGFIWGVGPRVEVAAAGLIQGYPYVGPAEDLKLR